MTPVTDKAVADLTRRSAEANAALVRGDIDGYLALIKHAQDFTLLTPFGGAPVRGFDGSSENRAAMARFFKSGTFHQEVVTTYDSGDLVVLVDDRAGACRDRRATRAGLVAARHAGLPP